MADLSKITLPSGTTYDIKDANARERIAALEAYSAYLGVTTTPLVDGSTTNPITIAGESVTAKHGEIVNYSSSEFIWNENITTPCWQQFGDLSALGALAYKDTASGTITPMGTVSQPTFTGSQVNVNITTAASSNGNYKPAGTVSQPTFSGNALTSTGKFTPTGGVTITTATTANKTATVSPASSGTTTYTPGGTVSQPTFSGDVLTSTGSYTPAGGVSLTNGNKSTTVSAAASGDTTYQPGGQCTGAAVELNTTTVNSITAVGTLPQCTLPTYTVSNETLTITAGSFNAGTLPTKGSNQTVATTVKSVTNPTFTGTAVRLVTGNISVPTSASFSGTAASLSVSGTPSGTVSQPSFTGTGVRLVTGNIPVPATYTGSFSGDEGNVSVSGTPSGTVSQPTFDGTKVQISGTTTAEGTVSQPTFTGTAGTVTVS